jgi:hypothetical protein
MTTLAAEGICSNSAAQACQTSPDAILDFFTVANKKMPQMAHGLAAVARADPERK